MLFRSAMAAVLVLGIAAIRVAIPDRAAAPVQLADAGRGVAPTAAPQDHPRPQRESVAPVRFIIDAKPESYERTQISF